MVNTLSGLNNLRTKVDDLVVNKLKTVSVVLKKLSDAVGKQIVKNAKFNKLNTKVCNLEAEFLMCLIKVRQINTTEINKICG